MTSAIFSTFTGGKEKTGDAGRSYNLVMLFFFSEVMKTLFNEHIKKFTHTLMILSQTRYGIGDLIKVGFSEGVLKNIHSDCGLELENLRTKNTIYVPVLVVAALSVELLDLPAELQKMAAEHQKIADEAPKPAAGKKKAT